MKKIISGISALILTATMAVPFSAFADDTTTKTINTDGGSDSTNVIYDATEKYFVTIPAGVTLKDTAVTANITASDVIINEGKVIKVSLTKADNTTSGNQFSAKNSDKTSTVSYNINSGDVSVGDVVAELDKDNLSKTLTFTKTDDVTPTHAGKHSENLTFTIGVENAKTDVSGVGIDNKTTIATTITRGSTLDLTATVDESATDKTVVWSSSDGTVASVDSTGKVTANKSGTATITVTATNGTEDTSDDKTDSITITVNPIMYAVSFDSNGGTGTMENVSVAENSEYTLPANSFTAPTGKEFDKWQIGDSIYADGAKVTITGDTAVNATWKDVNYAVTIGTFTNGSVTANSTAKMGDTVTLTVTPDTGYELDTLTVKDASNNPVTVTDNKFTMPAGGVTVSAMFKLSTYSISVNNSANGTVTADSTAKMGDTVTLTVTPDTGYELDTLTVTDASNNPVTVTNNEFTMPAGTVTVSATFKAQTYTVTFANGGGSGTMSNGTATYGTKYKLPANSFTAPTGKEFDKWQVGTNTYAVGTEIDITANTTVTATWKDILVTGITINNVPTEALFVNSKGTLTATVSPSGAANKTVTWSSSDPDYVTINAETGEYTVMGKKGYGSATITATATNGTDDTSDDVSATCTITGKVTYTSLSPGTVLHVGDTFYAGKAYFNTKPAVNFNDSNGVITLVEDNGCYKFKRGSNGTMPNVTAYKVKDNTDGIYIVSGSGTSTSDRFTIAVHTKDQ